jgi:hypothetical protein
MLNIDELSNEFDRMLFSLTKEDLLEWVLSYETKMITEQAKSVTDELIPIVDIILTKEDIKKSQEILDKYDCLLDIIQSKNPTTCFTVNRLK